MLRKDIPIAYKRINPMIARTETSQLHLFPVFDLFSVAITPFNGNIRVGVRIHKYIECAITVELWKKCHGGGDLTENGLDLGLDLLLRLIWGWEFVADLTSEHWKWQEVSTKSFTRHMKHAHNGFA